MLKADYPVQTAYCQLRQAKCLEKLDKDLAAWTLVNLSVKNDDMSIDALIFRVGIVQRDSIDFNEIALEDLRRVKAIKPDYEKIEELLLMV